MITDRQMRFVQEYCKDFIATKAYVRAGYSEDGAASGASRLMENVNVQIAIEDEKRNNAAMAGLSRGYLVKELKTVVDSYRARACRYCHGINHEYQWTEREYERALTEALTLGLAAPDIKGGFGYTRRREPAENCPTCHGDGELRMSLDQPKLADKIKAIDSLSKLAGYVVDRKEVSGPGGGPIQTTTGLDLDSLSDDQLLELIRAKRLGEGTVEGTCVDVTPNSSPVSELEGASSP